MNAPTIRCLNQTCKPCACLPKVRNLQISKFRDAPNPKPFCYC
jgi:hypothetical protein